MAATPPTIPRRHPSLTEDLGPDEFAVKEGKLIKFRLPGRRFAPPRLVYSGTPEWFASEQWFGLSGIPNSILMKVKNTFSGLGWAALLKAALPVFLAAGFCLGAYYGSAGILGANWGRDWGGPGSYLLAGLPGADIGRSMPLFPAALAASFSRALARFPGDGTAHSLACRELWAKGDDEGFRDCLGASNRRFGDRAAAYFLAAFRSGAPRRLPVPPGAELECLIIRMLRELDLGDTAAAGVSFREAYNFYAAGRKMLRGAPQIKDAELAELVKADVESFLDSYVYMRLFLWPVGRLKKILSGLEKIAPPAGRLEQLKGLLAGPAGAGESLPLRTWVAADVFGLPCAKPGTLWKEGAKRSKNLSDAAVDRMRAGDLEAAEALLLKAAGLNPSGPEIFMNLCALRARRGGKGAAAEACRRAAYVVYANPENRLPQYDALASDALFESYRLLGALGRAAEAEDDLRAAVRNAPAGWRGLKDARAELAGAGRK